VGPRILFRARCVFMYASLCPPFTCVVKKIDSFVACVMEKTKINVVCGLDKNFFRRHRQKKNKAKDEEEDKKYS
jgi:hypothetical protein